MYNRLDSIPSCNRRTDRQTDGQTSCHGIVRAMHTRRVVKTNHCTSFTSLDWVTVAVTDGDDNYNSFTDYRYKVSYRINLENYQAIQCNR